jgi:hypothetical protein
MKKLISNIIKLFTVLIISGCVQPPIPEVKQTKQKIRTINTEQLDKISTFAKQLNDYNLKTIYIYIDKDGSRNESGVGAGELPPVMRRLLTSILTDFGPKVKVVDSASLITNLITNPLTANNVYILDGAITMYDKDIMSQSSGFNLGIDFGGGNAEGNTNSDFKDKDKLSILGVDFYLRQNGFITYKTSSQIDIKATTKGYNFGISINNAGIGASGYKSIKDGIGLSTRKLLQESMYNLIKQVYTHN